ncbi:metallophosphoesterase family protein [Bacillus sp. V2I10]|uniref:metallophosphoesterase family protein n=1 Tax=Bacillus sp. V2I10 TaxID=3042276 RepID=UPI0027D863E8|nr:metallophosphoesterase family protein [Bacillus sp. V2I10]
MAISDVHGCYDEFLKLLELIKYNPASDQLILLGDYLDRGPMSKETLCKVISLVDEGAIALRGNHDQMFYDWIQMDNERNDLHFFINGGYATITSYVGHGWFKEIGYDNKLVKKAKRHIQDHYQTHLEFIEKLPYFYENEDYIFVHAGINPNLKNWKMTDEKDFMWIRDQFLFNDHTHNHTIVHGHTPNTLIHKSNDIYIGNNKIGIDGSCAYGGQLNCLEIRNDSIKKHHVMSKNKM